MQQSIRIKFEHTLKLKKLQLAHAKDRYKKLDYEYRTLRSALDIIDQHKQEVRF